MPPTPLNTEAIEPGMVLWVQNGAPGTVKAVRAIAVAGNTVEVSDGSPYGIEHYPISRNVGRALSPHPSSSKSEVLDDAQIANYVQTFRESIAAGDEAVRATIEAFAIDPRWSEIKQKVWPALPGSERVAIRSAIVGSVFAIPESALTQETKT